MRGVSSVMNPKLKKGLNIALTVLIVIILLFGLFMIVAAFTNRSNNNSDKNALGNIGGYSFLYVQTDSMTPDIPVGSFLIIKKKCLRRAI